MEFEIIFNCVLASIRKREKMGFHCESLKRKKKLAFHKEQIQFNNKKTIRVKPK